jgi:general secretion pathway protein G
MEMAASLKQKAREKGFTLIELLIVLAIVALLLTLAVPRYFSSLDKSKSVVLEQNLKAVRDTIDKFYADKGRYPDSLQELVSEKYLKDLPVDPVTNTTDAWVVVPPEPPAKGGVFDLHSGAPGVSASGKPYAEM